MAQPIRYHNSVSGKLETESVYGDWAVRFLYANAAGSVARGALTRGAFSRVYGKLQSSAWSARKIPEFVRAYGIDLSLFEVPAGGFASFNDFFIRRFKPGVRPFEADPAILPAFAEARYLGWEGVTPAQTFPVKGRDLTADQLLGSSFEARTWAKHFENGPVLLARLCPVDYHRYHYPDGGRTLAAWDVAGRLESVNPWALQARGELFSTNKRRVAVLETQSLGKLAFIEVGAMGVGRIVQSHDEKRPFERGDEKGYFLFGGSTVIVLGEAGRWKPTAEILSHTRAAREVWVPLGRAVGAV